MSSSAKKESQYGDSSWLEGRFEKIPQSYMQELTLKYVDFESSPHNWSYYKDLLFFWREPPYAVLSSSFKLNGQNLIKLVPFIHSPSDCHERKGQSEKDEYLTSSGARSPHDPYFVQLCHTLQTAPKDDILFWVNEDVTRWSGLWTPFALWPNRHTEQMEIVYEF